MELTLARIKSDAGAEDVKLFGQLSLQEKLDKINDAELSREKTWL